MRNKPILGGLRVRLLGLFLLVATAPIVVGGYIAYTHARSTVEDNTLRFITAINELKQQQVSRWLEDGAGTLETLAQRPLVVAYAAELVAGRGTDSGDEDLRVRLLQDHLVPVLRHQRAFDGLGLFEGHTGMPIVAVGTVGSLGQIAAEAYFQEGRARTYVQPVVPSLNGSGHTMHVATPILDGEGQTIAVVVGSVATADLAHILGFHADVWETEDTYLVSEGYRIVTRPRFATGSVYGLAVSSPGAVACFTDKQGTGTYPDYRGKTVVGYYEWLPDLNVCMLTEVDHTEAFGPVQALRGLLQGLGTTTVVVGIALALVTGTWIVGPLHRLTQGARAVGRGDLDHRINLRRRDELGLLAESFNSMAVNLQASMGDASHGRHLLSQLSRAAEAVQRARNPSAIYEAVGAGIGALGFNAIILAAQADSSSTLRIAHMTWSPTLPGAAERLAGMTAADYAVDWRDVPIFRNAVAERNAVLVNDPSLLVGQALPPSIRALTGGISDMANLGAAVVAPMVVDDRVIGILEVTGEGLQQVDVSAIATFANQAAIALENANLYMEVAGYAEELESRVAVRTSELNDARLAALNMMADADLARREAEETTVQLRREVEERSRVQVELQRSNEELEQFAYIASHDLQEPLRKVQAFGDRLLSRYGSELPERGRDYLARMMNAAQRGQRMVNDLLAYSRVATRAQPFSRVDLQALTESVIEDLEIRIEQAGGAVTAVDLPAIDADASQMRQLLANLIGNGLKFHREDVPPVISVRGRLLERGDEGWCEILVTDNGIGFDTRYLDRIMQPFQRLHGRSEYEGSGIGLAICKKIVDRHGGSVGAESEPGAGATFVVTLPVSQPEASDGRR